MKTVLVTGGLGYIGSHTVLSLIKTGYCVVIVDNLSNSEFNQLEKIEIISHKEIFFYNINICDEKKISDLFNEYDISSIIHFAALKSIPESLKFPEKYYENNINGTSTLLNVAKKFNVKKFIFSSTAAIYGDSNFFPVDEHGSLAFNNPYTESKYESEKLISDWVLNCPNASAIILRYFNPIGNHPSGLIGDSFKGNNSNIMPMLLKSIKDKKKFMIFGDNYDTYDGSPVRDYIHVLDLAEAHINSLNYLNSNYGLQIFNVGYGHGISVIELIETFQKVNSIKLLTVRSPRRTGDLAQSFTKVDKIKNFLNWSPRYDLKTMCKDAYCFYLKNQI